MDSVTEAEVAIEDEAAEVLQEVVEEPHEAADEVEEGLVRRADREW